MRARSTGREREYPEHPLHHVYRRRMRGLRMRWFASGIILGALGGVLLTLIASALVVTQIPQVLQSITGEPDVSVVISESYLNRAASDRIAGGYNLGVPGLNLVALQLGLRPGNLMDLTPSFRVNAGFLSFDISPRVSNQLSVKDGRIAINMIGDPQIGNLNLPLEFLPFNLKDRTTQAVDKVNNDLLISEINQSLTTGFGGSGFDVTSCATENGGLTIRLKHH
ncbi:MAG TPA: hypothetical protein VHS06_08860 [Chloroflexota bacterium]|nr:hypothetical protein [Chloroflexota bacterium]